MKHTLNFQERRRLTGRTVERLLISHHSSRLAKKQTRAQNETNLTSASNADADCVPPAGEGLADEDIVSGGSRCSHNGHDTEGGEATEEAKTKAQ